MSCEVMPSTCTCSTKGNAATRRTQEPQCTPNGKRMLSGWLSSTTTWIDCAGFSRAISGQLRWWKSPEPVNTVPYCAGSCASSCAVKRRIVANEQPKRIASCHSAKGSTRRFGSSPTEPSMSSTTGRGTEMFMRAPPRFVGRASARRTWHVGLKPDLRRVRGCRGNSSHDIHSSSFSAASCHWRSLSKWPPSLRSSARSTGFLAYTAWRVKVKLAPRKDFTSGSVQPAT